MDKLQWFKFAPSDWMMGKIQRCPEVTKSRFIRLCCLYWNNECTLSYEDAEIDLDNEHLNILISKKVISTNDGFINIDFLDVQFAEIEEVSKDKSKSGVIGNLKRWHSDVYKRFKAKEISLEEALIIAQQSHTDSTTIAQQSQNIAEKRREEKNREENTLIDFEKFTDWFNLRRTQYLEIPSNIKRLTHSEKTTLALLKLDYTKEDFELAMHNLCNDDWANKNNQVLCSYFLQTKIFNKFLSVEKRPMITKRQRINRGGIS